MRRVPCVCAVQDRTQVACGVELVICHPGCVALQSRKHRAPCLHGIPLRTGWDLKRECKCNASLADGMMLNCGGSPAPGSHPADPEIVPEIERTGSEHASAGFRGPYAQYVKSSHLVNSRPSCAALEKRVSRQP